MNLQPQDKPATHSPGPWRAWVGPTGTVYVFDAKGGLVLTMAAVCRGTFALQERRLLLDVSLASNAPSLLAESRMLLARLAVTEVANDAAVAQFARTVEAIVNPKPEEVESDRKQGVPQ